MTKIFLNGCEAGLGGIDHIRTIKGKKYRVPSKGEWGR